MILGVVVGFIAGYWWATFLGALYEPKQTSNHKERSMDTQQWRDVYIRGSNG